MVFQIALDALQPGREMMPVWHGQSWTLSQATQHARVGSTFANIASPSTWMVTSKLAL